MTRRITLVEDDATFAGLLKYNLEFHGFAVECISCGTEARHRFAHAPCPDLVILDWNLPGLNGSEVLRQMRLQTSTARVPVVMFTCRTDRNDKDYAFELGVTDYVYKTMPLSTLFARIQSLVSPLI